MMIGGFLLVRCFFPLIIRIQLQRKLVMLFNIFYFRSLQDPFGHTTTVTFDSPNDLLIVKIQDPVDNVVSVGERDTAGDITMLGINYRLLQPFSIMDPNQNRSMVTFDALGMVVGTAIMGKPTSC